MELFDHQRVAADIPARLEPDARVGLADFFHGADVIVGVIGGGDEGPMALLGALGHRHVAFVGEEFLGRRSRRHLIVEDLQRRPDRMSDQRLQGFAQRLQRFIIHAR